MHEWALFRSRSSSVQKRPQKSVLTHVSKLNALLGHRTMPLSAVFFKQQARVSMAVVRLFFGASEKQAA